MGLESTLRTWAHSKGLQSSRSVVAAYRWFSILRYRSRWDEPVSFRGAEFSIGRDLSLYPAVANGGFEAGELDALLPRVSATATVWDVGANIGIYSVLMGRAATRGHVVAFEPVPETRARLSANLERNAVSNVTVEGLALSDRPGETHMVVNPDAHGCDHIAHGDAHDSETTIRVKTNTGDRYAADSPLGDPDIIKVDIEGHEPEFLHGCWEILRRRQPILMLEVNPTAWGTTERYETWAETLADLFNLYSEGIWFGTSGPTRVRQVDLTNLGTHAYSLLLPAL